MGHLECCWLCCFAGTFDVPAFDRFEKIRRRLLALGFDFGGVGEDGFDGIAARAPDRGLVGHGAEPSDVIGVAFDRRQEGAGDFVVARCRLAGGFARGRVSSSSSSLINRFFFASILRRSCVVCCVTGCVIYGSSILIFAVIPDSYDRNACVVCCVDHCVGF
jgi:hypothetical protein